LIFACRNVRWLGARWSLKFPFFIFSRLFSYWSLKIKYNQEGVFSIMPFGV
jgi:hypothetical protein